MTRPSGDVGTEVVVDEATEVVLNGSVVGKLVVKFGELPSQAATANAANNRTPHPTTSATPGNLRPTGPLLVSVLAGYAI
jgi:hypothetical protein